jgi:hypothetical protein
MNVGVGVAERVASAPPACSSRLQFALSDHYVRLGNRRADLPKQTSKMAAYRQMKTNIARLLPLVVAFACGPADCPDAACFDQPTVVNQLELHASCGERVWAIVGDGSSTLVQVRFGEVPPGYRQIFPSSGRPRALRSGECVVLLWQTRSAFTQHWGRAGKAGAVRYGVWQSRPVKIANAELFRAAGENKAERPDCPPCQG